MCCHAMSARARPPSRSRCGRHGLGTTPRPVTILSLLALLPPGATPTCVATYANCHTTRCCSSKTDACFKRTGKAYHQCRPYRSGQLLPSGLVSGCIDTPVWECPKAAAPPPAAAHDQPSTAATPPATTLLRARDPVPAPPAKLAAAAAARDWTAEAVRPSSAPWNDTSHALGLERLWRFRELRTVEARPGQAVRCSASRDALHASCQRLLMRSS